MSKDTKSKLDKFWTKEYEWLGNEIRTNIAKGMMSEYADDLIQHMVIETYKMKEEKLEQMLENGKLKWYILTSAGLALRSSTSPFYHKYRKQKMNARSGYMDGHRENPYDMLFDPEVEGFDTELYQCFQGAMEDIHWYLRHLLERKYMQGWTYEQLKDTYQISKTHLLRDINTALEEIREKCKHI